MEHMVNDILKYGDNRRNLEVKICGGGRVFKSTTMIGTGKKEYRFCKRLRSNGESVAAGRGSRLDTHPRKVQYNPATGKMKIKKLRSMHNNTILKREFKYRLELENDRFAGKVELF